MANKVITMSISTVEFCLNGAFPMLSKCAAGADFMVALILERVMLFAQAILLSAGHVLFRPAQPCIHCPALFCKPEFASQAIQRCRLVSGERTHTRQGQDTAVRTCPRKFTYEVVPGIKNVPRPRLRSPRMKRDDGPLHICSF